MSELPFIDEHSTTIVAGVDEVWAVLVDRLDRSISRSGVARYARVIQSDPDGASGPRPLTEGSTIPGFRVTSAVPGSELVLEGRHRFSSYSLTFRLERLGPDQSRLRAESRATFPGAAGSVYRLLVVRSRGHRLVVRRLLAGIEQRSEQ